VFPVISAIASYGNVVIPDLWNVSSFLFIALFALISFLLFYLIDRASLKRAEKNQ
jgi:hypothetical protein